MGASDSDNHSDGQLKEVDGTGQSDNHQEGAFLFSELVKVDGTRDGHTEGTPSVGVGRPDGHDNGSVVGGTDRDSQSDGHVNDVVGVGSWLGHHGGAIATALEEDPSANDVCVAM